jgi:RNA polymerase sigma factor (TIGR02999 family)
MPEATPPITTEATLLLERIRQGDPEAAEKLLPLVYDQLRAMAGAYFKREPANHTLQPTALVHEAWMRMIPGTGREDDARHYENSAHFLAIAATAMRNILTDYARRRRAEKRGGEWQKVGLDRAASEAGSEELDVVALDEVLTRLKEFDPRKHRITELRFFGGLTVEQIAGLLAVSKTTVENEWRAARAWLSVQLQAR